MDYEETLTLRHEQNISIDNASVFETCDFDLKELWDEFTSNQPNYHQYKSLDELSEDTLNIIVKYVDRYELESEEFLSIDFWVDHFGDSYNIEYSEISGQRDYFDTSSMMGDLVNYLKENRIFDMMKNPLYHAVQGEVNKLKEKREIRKVRAETLISSIRLNLEKSLSSYDETIESKLLTNLNNQP